MRCLLPVMISVVAATGCTDLGEPEEHDDTDAKADGVTRPVGTYTLPMERTDDEIGGIHLSLMTDRSFRREENLDPFVGPTVDRGRYRYSKSGERRFILMTYDDGRYERLEYQLVESDAVLRLRKPGTSRWAVYEQDSARCDSDEDCDGQGMLGADCYYSGCIDEFPDDL